MAKVIWAEPALSDLDAIADYIALDKPSAAAHPKSGSKPPELRGWRYRQIIEPPCRVFYREDNGRVLIL